MNELKPEDVMKALECCKTHHINACRKCPYYSHSHCFLSLHLDTIALLREKDALIEALTKNNADLETELAQTHDAVEEKNAEIERLGEEKVFALRRTIENAKANARADAITEFAQRLIKYYNALKNGLAAYHIEQIAKEMKEQNNES